MPPLQPNSISAYYYLPIGVSVVFSSSTFSHFNIQIAQLILTPQMLIDRVWFRRE
jgi:hypothetical protein